MAELIGGYNIMVNMIFPFGSNDTEIDKFTYQYIYTFRQVRGMAVPKCMHTRVGNNNNIIVLIKYKGHPYFFPHQPITKHIVFHHKMLKNYGIQRST